jgi:general secretion pathway protein G
MTPNQHTNADTATNSNASIGSISGDADELKRGRQSRHISIVMAVILVHAGCAIDPLTSKQESRVVLAREQIKQLQKALVRYQADVGSYPSVEEGFDRLEHDELNDGRWRGPYLQKAVPFDPWGNPYVYVLPGRDGKRPDIVSYGADGAPGGVGPDEDIVSDWSHYTNERRG